MLARSTASRHGDGRIWANATSMTSSSPLRTRRLAGLMSRWASPAFQSWRTIRSPWSITSSSTVASVSSTAPSKNSVTTRYSRLGVSSTMPERRGRRDPGVTHHAQRVVLLLGEAADATGTAPRPRVARRGWCGTSCTSGPPARGSWRRSCRRRACRRPGAGAAVSSHPTRRGRSVRCRRRSSPSCSPTAVRIASARRPPMSRWAALRRR